MQDRYRGGGGGRQGGGGGNRYGGRRRRGRGGGRPHDIFPEVGVQETEEHGSWAEEFDREPNPDAMPLHLAYDSVYTHEGDVREELLENWVSQSESGKRWRCWNCGKTTQRFTQLRLPTLRTVISICDNCGTWTVWDAWRDIANPRIFNFRRTIEDTEPAPVREVGPSPSAVAPAVGSNGSGTHGPAPTSASPPLTGAPPASPAETAAPAAPALPAPPAPVAEEPAAKPRRTRASAKASGEAAPDEDTAPKPRATRSRAKNTEPEASGE